MTTPSQLHPGDRIQRRDDASAPVFVFVRRNGSYLRFQCDRYRGLDGPDDPGFVDVRPWDLSHHYQRAEVHA